MNSDLEVDAAEALVASRHSPLGRTDAKKTKVHAQ